MHVSRGDVDNTLVLITVLLSLSQTQSTCNYQTMIIIASDCKLYFPAKGSFMQIKQNKSGPCMTSFFIQAFLPLRWLS